MTNSPLNQEKQRIVYQALALHDGCLADECCFNPKELSAELDALHAAVVREDRTKIRAIPHSQKCEKNSWERQKAVCICGTSEVIDRASEAIAPNKDKEE